MHIFLFLIPFDQKFFALSFFKIHTKKAKVNNPFSTLRKQKEYVNLSHHLRLFFFSCCLIILQEMILKFTKHHVKSHASNIPNIIFKTYFHYSKNQSKNHVSNRSLSSKNPIISLVRLIPSSAAGIFPLSCHSAKESSFGSSDILAFPLRLTKKPYKMLLSIPHGWLL